MKEGDKIKEILGSLPPNKRLFRINAGLGWTGRVQRQVKNMLILLDPRPLKAAPKGWPDLCGWETVEITPEMVGKKIAVFVFEEVKVTGKLTREQALFKRVLEKMGGIFRIHGPD
ncbi:hypothetical protein KAR91_17015 [Candidatus Pacearchaeota archaeon]|nr:hypothetical protein [Candidatus Pacearchaeota archaeon]